MEDTETLFRLLAAYHRRRILFLLCDTESIQLPEALLARGQARSEQEDTDSCSPPGQPTASEDESLDQLQIELHHNHLPELEGKELIEWNRDTETVSRGPRFQELAPVLRLFGANHDRFPDDLF